MRINLIAVHYSPDMKNIIAFRLYDSDNNQVRDQPYNNVLNVLANKRADIIGIKYEHSTNTLKGSNGAFDRYPKLINNNLVSNGIIILNTIDDIGYKICNFKGETIEVEVSEVIKLANRINISNGKLVTKDNKQFISAISGEYLNIELNKSDKLKNKIDLKQKNIEYAENLKKKLPRSYGSIRFPKVITGTPAKNSKMQELDETTNLTVEQKMAYTMLGLRAVRPFLHSIFNVIERKEANPEDGIKTMGVTTNTLYFSADFVRETPLSELLFVFIHEVYHIGMKHRAREGNRDHDIWNTACDYFINKQIASEFNLQKNIITETHSTNGQKTNYMISLPDWVLYNDKIDINKDTPEKIYEELVSLMENQEDSDNGQQSSNGDQSNQSSENSSSSGNNSDSSQNSQNNQNSQEDYQENELEDFADGKQKEDNKNKDDSTNKNNGSSNANNNDNNQGKDKQEGRLVGKEFRGQKIPDVESDIIDDNNSRTMSQEQLNQVSNSLLNRAVVQYKQTNKFGGDTADFLERYVEKALAPKVNWRSLLKSKLIVASQKINTFSAPDKRFRSRNMVLPGPKALDNDSLKDVKICVDTSGSISPKDLGVALAQVEQLLNTYKAEAELLYWDTRIRAIYPFKNIKELLNKQPLGGGGTDANCIFEYFETNRDYKIGKKAKPSIIIIFTDGYIRDMESKYKKYKNTIWVVQGNTSFTVPFGTKAIFKNED